MQKKVLTQKNECVSIINVFLTSSKKYNRESKRSILIYIVK